MISAGATSGSTRVNVIILLTTFLVLSWSIGFAEMRVITYDGRTLTLPVQSGEVQRIEFTGGSVSTGYRYLGCYRDQGDPTGTANRDLSGYVLNDSGMTTEKCVSLCRDRGFQYAGTQYSSWCFCGNSYGRTGSADNCNMKCAGNNSQTCGGAWANSVYSLR